MAGQGRNPDTYTPERMALVMDRELGWRGMRPWQFILADFNGMPGNPITLKQLQNLAVELKLKRGLVVKGTGRDWATYTVAREELMCCEILGWTSTRPARAILADFNALDPTRPVSMKSMQTFGARLGLSRPPGAKGNSFLFAQGLPIKDPPPKAIAPPEPPIKPETIDNPRHPDHPDQIDRHDYRLGLAGIRFDDHPGLEDNDPAPYIPIMSRPDPLADERLARRAAQARMAGRDVSGPAAREMRV